MNIVDVVSRYVELDRRGWACCPFHAERTPSFHVRPDTDTFKCFGCGVGGDALGFVMRIERVGYREAAERYGERTIRVPLPPRPPRPWQADPERLVERYASAPDTVPLWAAYRPLTAPTIAAWELGVGVLPASKCGHRRLIVPVRRQGKVVALAGRAIGCDCAKWLLAGGSEFALFNLDFVSAGSTVVVVENRADAVLGCQEWPDCVTVAKGSANVWRPEWTAAFLERRPAFVLFWPDNDEAGYLGASRGANELLGVGLVARVRQWSELAPAKADLGQFLAALRESRCAA